MSSTKRFCLKKDGIYISWDGKSMTDRPSQAIRLSKTLCQRKYPDYQMISFPDAYDQWFTEKKAREAER